MGYKNIPNEVKVEALKEALVLKDVKEIALKHSISEETIKTCYNKVINGIDEIIRNEKPGPKTNKKAETKKVARPNMTMAKFTNKKESLVCNICGSTNVVKNGTYTVINWVYRMISLLMPFLHLDESKRIQKYICNNCKSSVAGIDKHKSTYLRNAIKLQIGKLICILRFKHGLSIRSISAIIKSIYGVNGSVGYVTELSNKISSNAKTKLDTINSIEQEPAKVMIFDETFPKSKKDGTINLGVIVDENGLIRKVKSILKKKMI